MVAVKPPLGQAPVGSGFPVPCLGSRAAGIAKRSRPESNPWSAVARILKRAGQYAGLAPDAVAALSGHSLRVGTTQDLLALNQEMPGVMQAGRWKTPAMSAHYGAQTLAAQGAVARAAELQGRDK